MWTWEAVLKLHGLAAMLQVPSEVLSLETRSAGYSITTFMNFIMTFVRAQHSPAAALTSTLPQACMLAACFCRSRACMGMQMWHPVVCMYLV